MKTITAFSFLSLAFCVASAAHADTFGNGVNEFDIDFVTIGNPGNADDTTGDPNPAGKVDSTYRIGQFEISEDMIDKANAQSSLSITHDNRGPNKPATNVSWFEAAHFVNWLNTDSGSTEAYKFNRRGNIQLWTPADAGYNPNNLYRNSLATYFLPSVDEWYKAAYYDPTGGVYYDYPTGSDTAPLPVASGTEADTAVYEQSFSTGPADTTLTGGLSPYGTMGQGGNVWEWEETDFDLVNDSSSSARGVRGGDWGLNSNILLSSDRFNVNPPFESSFVGFRVASIPEPSTLLLSLLGLSAVCMRRRRHI
jgi:sulfatase modifying factor 1